MPRPEVSVLLCTVRDDLGYRQHPEWTTLGKVIDDLSRQTFQDFELIVVDGLWDYRSPVDAMASDDVERFRVGVSLNVARGSVTYPIVHVAPKRESPWVRDKRVAICAYRNTGLRYARGQLVVNLDDCCELPPTFLESYATAWKRGFGGSVVWPDSPDSNDRRLEAPHYTPRIVGPPQPPVYGFSAYPLDLAVDLNGYDESFDGGQGLEDADWSARLSLVGLQFVLFYARGFTIHEQSGHDPRAVSPDRAIVKCCNPAWHMARVRRCVTRANTADLWSRGALEALVGPCWLLRQDGTCEHHHGVNMCAYPHFAKALTPEAAVLFDRPPVFDLAAERRRAMQALARLAKGA